MVIVLLLFVLKTVGSAILRGPSNVAVVAGTNMTMTCEPTPGTNTVDWYHSQVRSKGMTPINYGSTILKNYSEFSVGGKPPGELLILKITQLKHAEYYQCTATGQKATAQLVVLASEPQCNFSSREIKEGTSVNLFCSVSYNGYWAPFMQWSQTVHGNINVRTIPVKEIAIEPIENELTSKLSLVINSSTQGYRYSCKTHFNNTPSSEAPTTATNTPEYESIWTSPATGMFYGPKNVTVSPTKDVFHPDDVLTCSADSTLSSELEWTEMETGSVFIGPNIVLNASMVRDEPYSFSCTATNILTLAYVKSRIFTFTVKRVPAEDESSLTTACKHAENSADKRRPNLILIISVTATSVVMSIAFAGCLIVFSKKRKRKRMSALQKVQQSPGPVTPPASTAEDTFAIYAVVSYSSSTHKDVAIDVQPISLGGALSGSYEEIETESEGSPSSCYNLGHVSGERKLTQNDEDFGSNERNSNSSVSSKETVTSTKYEDLLERDPVKPNVYLRIMQAHKEQETQTSNSPTSSENSTQSQAIYVNMRKERSNFSVKV